MNYAQLSDQDIVARLIDKDNGVTAWFFQSKCRPLFLSIMRKLFSIPVDYNEVVNEIYALLFEDNARRLRQFDFRSSLCQWIKVVAIRYLLRNYNNVIGNETDEPLYEQTDVATSDPLDARLTLESLLTLLEPPRYVYVINELILKDRPPKDVAKDLDVSVDNLYNIKKRAIDALRHLAIKQPV